MNRRQILTATSLPLLVSGAAVAENDPGLPLPSAKPLPRMQVLPLPNEEAAFQRDGVELTRYRFAAGQRRPFLYPIVGPAGRSLTRMGHPRAPYSHSHHNSLWVSHNDVNGDVFWADNGAGRIVHQWMVAYEDGVDQASLVAVNHWIGKDDRVHLVERRGIAVSSLPNGEWLLLLDLHLEAGRERATLGKTPFGLAAVRMAKTIGVADGGGMIRNSEGHVNEQGANGVFWKRARWVDYSGPITPEANEGIAFLDHPANPNHPSYFHVREDGWMGSCLTFDTPRIIEPGHPLRLRYGFYIHRGVPTAATIEKQWKPFAETQLPELPGFRK